MSDTTDLPVNDDGTHVATLSPAGVPWACPIGYLDHAVATGYTVDHGQPAPGVVPLGPIAPTFDPDEHNVDEVNAHLADAFDRGDVTEIERVLSAEAAGKNRSTITDPTGGPAGDNA